MARANDTHFQGTFTVLYNDFKVHQGLDVISIFWDLFFEGLNVVE